MVKVNSHRYHKPPPEKNASLSQMKSLVFLLLSSLLGALAISNMSMAQAQSNNASRPTSQLSLPISLTISDPFLALTDEGIRSVFPVAAGRPQAVIITKDRKLSVAFEWRQGRLKLNEVSKLLTQFPPIIRKKVPKLTGLQAKLITLGGHSWARFVFTTPSQGDSLRRELLMSSIGGRVFVITIAASSKDYQKHADKLNKVLGTLKVSKTSNKVNN